MSDVQTRLLVEFVHFSRNSQCSSTLASCKRNCWAKYCTDWLRSKYKWHHANNVIVIKIPVYVPN